MTAWEEAQSQTNEEMLMLAIADDCNREAVTFQWFYDNMDPDATIWLYDTEDCDVGLDPWKEITDYDVKTNGTGWWANDIDMDWADTVYIQTRDKLN